MNEVFADSFYWIALLNPADAFHEAARRTPVSGRIVTSVAVQLEVLDAFATNPSLRPTAIHFWECTNRDPQVTVVPLDATGAPFVSKECREALRVRSGDRVHVTPLP